MFRQIARTLAALAIGVAASSAQATPVLELPTVDVAAVLAQDALQPGPRAFRFAVPIPVALTPASAGEWQPTADGAAVWRLTVRSRQATSLNLGFTRYQLPPGATLSVSAVDGSERRGPYGSEYNGQGQLWTPVVRGNAAQIELRVPAASREAAQLTLGVVNHGFRAFGAKDEVQVSASPCNIDVVCGDGDAWRDEIRSVARYTVAGTLLCTGSLVNNSARDFTPYFLTANHCVATAALAPTTVFYWNYQTSRCGGTPDGSLEQTQSGAIYLAGSGGATEAGSDFTLLKLLSQPDPAFQVYFAGWDNRDLAPVGVTGIHHPNGDEKRISTDFDATAVTAYAQQPGTPQSALMPTHLLVSSWDRGVTEGGSSGSGLWNREHRLVGQLSGGESSCSTPHAPDWYGRMHANFFDLDTPLTSLRIWLDPKGGTEVLDGIDSATAPAPVAGDLPGASGSDAGKNTSTGNAGGAFASAPLLWWLAVLRRRRTRSERR